MITPGGFIATVLLFVSDGALSYYVANLGNYGQRRNDLGRLASRIASNGVLGTWIILPRRLCEMLVPNVVRLPLYTPTPSVPPNPMGVRGWQGVPAPV